jgi:hypothetical protein
MKILSHPECCREIIEQSDFVASTSGLMDYMRKDASGQRLPAADGVRAGGAGAGGDAREDVHRTRASSANT